jgi:hypothetical protein
MASGTWCAPNMARRVAVASAAMSWSDIDSIVVAYGPTIYKKELKKYEIKLEE